MRELELLTRTFSSPRHLPRGVAWLLLSILESGPRECSLSMRMGLLPPMRGMPGEEGARLYVFLDAFKHMTTRQSHVSSRACCRLQLKCTVYSQVSGEACKWDGRYSGAGLCCWRRQTCYCHQGKEAQTDLASADAPGLSLYHSFRHCRSGDLTAIVYVGMHWQ